jgi:hypothetical protein
MISRKVQKIIGLSAIAELILMTVMVLLGNYKLFNLGLLVYLVALIFIIYLIITKNKAKITSNNVESNRLQKHQ